MLRITMIALFAFSAVLASESSDYIFNYKMPKISADMVQQMKGKLKHKIVEVAKAMEEECKYVKAMGQYGFTIEMAMLVGNGKCSVDNDITQLESFKTAYKTSLISCFEEMNTTASFDERIDEIVIQIQEIDQAAKSEDDACSGDEDCEKQVYAKTHSAISSLYANGIAEIKVAEDQALTDSLSGIAKCMVPKVSDSLKQMYVAIESLQSCISDGAESLAGLSAKSHNE